MTTLNEEVRRILNDPGTFLHNYSMLKPKILSAVLSYCREKDRPVEYEFLKYSLEIYWDNPQELYNSLINYHG